MIKGNKWGFIIILFLSMLLIINGGCIEEAGIDIKLKQIIPITPTTSIEITKNLNFNDIDIGRPQNYIVANSKFRIPIEIKNYNKIDYDEVYIRIIKDSPLIKNLLLYSYSGKAFETPQEGFFKFDNKLIAKQSNELAIVGEVGDLPLNLTQGIMSFSLELNQLNQSQYTPIQDSLHQYQLKICKTSGCL